MWDLIVSVPDHCLSFYFTGQKLSSYLYQNYSTIDIVAELRWREAHS